MIGNSMTAAAVSLDRLADEISSSAREIEASLALGATSRQASAGLVTRSLRSGMIPLIDSTKTTGVVFFPGTMVGMLVAGAEPVDAVRLQLILLWALLGSVALAGAAGHLARLPRLLHPGAPAARDVRRALPLALAALLAAAGCDSDEERVERPNVVVIMTDDQRVDEMAVLPAVRRLVVRPGAWFSRSFASFPLCCPSRATFLTGQYAHNHGVLDNRPPRGGYDRLDSSETLPVWLQRAGYETAHVGKYLNGYGTARPREVPPGWDEWHAVIDPTTYYYRGYVLNENGSVVRPRRYQTDELTRARAALPPRCRAAVLPEPGLPGAARRQARWPLCRLGQAGAPPRGALRRRARCRVRPRSGSAT